MEALQTTIIEGGGLTEKRIVRNKRIYIRVSEDEYSKIVGLARDSKLSVSACMRKSALGQSIVIIPDMKEMIRQIAKIGNNLNQLTMLAHQGKIKEIDLFPTEDALQQILKELKKINRTK